MIPLTVVPLNDAQSTVATLFELSIFLSDQKTVFIRFFSTALVFGIFLLFPDFQVFFEFVIGNLF
jgi:hypothetical protein